MKKLFNQNFADRFKKKETSKIKPLRLNIFFKQNMSSLSILGTRIPSSLSKFMSSDGWYVYSPQGSTKKDENLAHSLVFLDKSPINGLKNYLSGYFFPGIGPKTVVDLCDGFGMEIITYLQKGPLPKKFQTKVDARIISILEKGWERSKEEAISNIFFAELGFSNSQKYVIADKFGKTFITQLNLAPFDVLQEIPRLSFVEMGEILNRLNIEVSNEQVILAASNFRLRQSESRYGNTAAPLKSLIVDVSEMTGIDGDEILRTIETHSDQLPQIEAGSLMLVHSSASRDRDEAVRRQCHRIKNNLQPAGYISNFGRSDLEISDGVELSDEQLSAINLSVNEPISIITGGPGAGKTTMVLGLVTALELLGKKVKICAPTGRAAKRIEDNPALKKFEPSTIHRYFFSPEGLGEKKFDVMIVDEASMIDINLFIQLLESIPNGASLVFIGDPNQLPPVGPGQPFKDIIDSNSIPISRLTGNFRQAEFSDIIKAARSIIEGDVPKISYSIDESDFIFIETPEERVAEFVLKNYFEDVPKKLSIFDRSEFQILSPMHSHPSGIKNLNNIIQETLTAKGPPIFTKLDGKVETKFFMGDRVIMTSNNYELGVMNGDVGVVLRADEDKFVLEFGFLEVQFSKLDFLELDLAYAISIHKSQGSEYPAVIIPITSEHSFMLSRNLIYTALTRGKQQVVLVGQLSTLKKAISRVNKDKRYTGLKHSLAQRV